MTHHESTPPTKLSAVMIVRDEEDVLEGSIASVRGVVDEIVVLDTGSEDGTVELARRLGAVVHEAAWEDDFSAARNRALELATGDWVLWLDAGEKLVEDSPGRLRRFLEEESEWGRVYAVVIEVPPTDPEGSAEQTAQLRLIPRREDLRFSGRVRETLRPAADAAGMGIGSAPGRIARHPREHDPERKIHRAGRNLRLAGMEAGGNPDLPPRLLLAMGDALVDLNEPEKARQAYRLAVQAAEHESTEMLEGYYGLLTSLDGEAAADANARQRQVDLAVEALRVFPLDAQLLSALGNYLQGLDRLELAARSFETAARHGQVDPWTWHLREITPMACVCWSLVLRLQGQEERAREVLEEAMAEHADSPRIRRHLEDLTAGEDRHFRVDSGAEGGEVHRPGTISKHAASSSQTTEDDRRG